MKWCTHCGIKQAEPEQFHGRHAMGCPARWHDENEATAVIRLNPYQAANVLWMLRRAYDDIPALLTGDWNGEVLYQLEEAMRMRAGDFLTQTPNAHQKDWEV